MQAPRPTFLESAGEQAERLVRRFTPDPFVLVLALTLLTIALAFGLGLAGALPILGLDARDIIGVLPHHLRDRAAHPLPGAAPVTGYTVLS